MDPWHYPRSPASIELMLRFGQARGIAAERLLAGTRLAAADLKDPEATLSAAQELQVIRNLYAALPQAADAGLDVGLTYRLSTYGLLGYGLLSSATGEAALALARRLLPLTYTFAAIDIVTNGASLQMAFEPAPKLSGETARFVVERAMGATSRVLRDVIGTGFHLQAFELASPVSRAPATTTVFGAQVRHARARNAIRFPYALLQRPLPQANPMTAEMCERMCRELLRKRSPRIDTAAFIREHLAGHPFAHPPLVGDCARMLNTSERTLKRRLQDEGTSFRAISTMARLDRANALIREGRMSMAQIATDLGFSDPTTFTQAYKKWTGITPSKARTV
ncbi:MAG: AraC family transcriptional regulator [Stenotrophomonas sp.]|jgi:AraC-like DNA-binding protein|uniref:AraC family transcriptional regulator n=1 Tax=Stenotrophomonas sp. TaxID=69392 RepID=UPI00283E8E48|nr:AraC family transcriptional regulator ligand-binding domain-containing protein [Stenotrophomonas sp.]MDR2961668.1 AraC family transcriptional regulator [Stenotrophomonas sp.]